MKIKHLKLRNFRGFESLDLDLDRPLTLLVGTNGSGKTSILRSIAGVMERVGATNKPSNKIIDWRDHRIGAKAGELSIRFDHNRDFYLTLGYSHIFKENIDLDWEAAPNSIDFRRGPILLPYVFLIDTKRYVTSAYAIPSSPRINNIVVEPGYDQFVGWFKEQEDSENAKRVRERNFDVEDPQLQAVRVAVKALMPYLKDIRIQRDQTPVMVVNKNDVVLRLDQLSDGEQNLIALVGDLVRRMVATLPSGIVPGLAEVVFLLDEVEQHLHPGLQRKVIPALQAVFPKAQIIATTHSPQVLSSVPSSSIVVLTKDFQALSVESPTLGRDTNAILREVFGVTDRPEEVLKEINEIRNLIDQDQLTTARSKLDALAEKLSENDEQVLKLRTNLDFAETEL